MKYFMKLFFILTLLSCTRPPINHCKNIFVTNQDSIKKYTFFDVCNISFTDVLSLSKGKQNINHRRDNGWGINVFFHNYDTTMSVMISVLEDIDFDKSLDNTKQDMLYTSRLSFVKESDMLINKKKWRLIESKNRYTNKTYDDVYLLPLQNINGLIAIHSVRKYNKKASESDLENSRKQLNCFVQSLEVEILSKFKDYNTQEK
jgi:hypothetical protein